MMIRENSRSHRLLMLLVRMWVATITPKAANAKGNVSLRNSHKE